MQEKIIDVLPKSEELEKQAIAFHFQQNESLITDAIEKMKERAKAGFFSYDMEVKGLETKQINGVSYVLQALGYSTEYFDEEESDSGKQPEILFITWTDMYPAADAEDTFI